MDRHPSGSGMRISYDCCPQVWRLDQLEARLNVLDGEGSTISKGGVIGRLEKEHDENTKKLSRIMWVGVSILVTLVLHLARAIMTK